MILPELALKIPGRGTFGKRQAIILPESASGTPGLETFRKLKGITMPVYTPPRCQGSIPVPEELALSENRALVKPMPTVN